MPRKKAPRWSKPFVRQIEAVIRRSRNDTYSGKFQGRSTSGAVPRRGLGGGRMSLKRAFPHRGKKYM